MNTMILWIFFHLSTALTGYLNVFESNNQKILSTKNTRLFKLNLNLKLLHIKNSWNLANKTFNFYNIKYTRKF